MDRHLEAQHTGKTAWISSAFPGSAVERVGSALTAGLWELPGFRKVHLNKASGRMEELAAGAAPLELRRGLTRFGKSAFLLSLGNALPAYAACFVDSQNLAFLRPPRACVFVHDLFYLTHPNSALERLQGRLFYRGLESYAAVMVNSRYTRSQLLARFPIPPERVHVFPLGFDAKSFHPAPVDKARLWSGLGIPPGAKVLLHVSSGEERKNFHGVLRAFALLAGAWPDLYLIKAGRDLRAGSRALAESQAARLRVSGKVVFAGEVDESRLADLYRASDCFLFPSLAEGFGLPVLEAQACGCPTVTSNVTALPEVAGPLCITVDPRDIEAMARAVADILRDPSRRIREADGNAAWLAGFSWDPGRRFLEDFLTAAP